MLKQSLASSLGLDDVGAVGSVLAGKAVEALVLVGLVDVHQGVDDLGSLVLVLADGNAGAGDAGLSGLLDAVLLGVGNVKDENSFEILFGVLALDLHAGGGSRLRGVVEAADVTGVGGELVSVELDKVSVVLFGKAPHDAAGGLHIYTN